MGLYVVIAVEWVVCIAVVVLIVRAVRRDDAKADARIRALEVAKRAEVEAAQAEAARFVAQLQVDATNPGFPASTFVTDWARPMVLRLTLDLTDSTSVVDVVRIAHDAGRLISGLSEYETSIGGGGLILTEAKAAPGRVILTLTPKDATGAGSRVERVAEALNAAFDATVPTREAIPNLGNLPSDVSGAHAVALAA